MQYLLLAVCEGLQQKYLFLLNGDRTILAGRGNDGDWCVFQIDELEEKLSLCRQSMEEVDLKLRGEKLSHEGRKSLERERNLLMTKADNYEKELSVLRKENRKNAALAVAMVLLIALIYTCWTMWLHSRILPADQMILLQGALPSHHCTSPKGEDIGISDCCSCLSSPSLTLGKLKFSLRTELTEKTGWAEVKLELLPNVQSKPSGPMEKCSMFSLLKKMSGCRQVLSAQASQKTCHLLGCCCLKPQLKGHQAHWISVTLCIVTWTPHVPRTEINKDGSSIPT